MKYQKEGEMGVIPTVHCVVPVYNRLEVTKCFLQYICEQDYQAIRVIIVDDGSTDGTGEYLAQASQPNLTVLEGDGNLWWGGAMHLGMSYVMDIAQGSDYLLMINNDVRIKQDYVSTLVRESISNGAAVIGSSQRDDLSGKLLTSGWHIDFWGMHFVPVVCDHQNTTVDALPGRGVLFPMHAVFGAGKINARLFPHYLGDLEYTARVSEAGWKLIISKAADVFSSSESSDMQVRARGIFATHFFFNSSKNLLQKILFFCLHGPLLLRVLAIPRYPLILIAKHIWRLYDKGD